MIQEWHWISSVHGIWCERWLLPLCAQSHYFCRSFPCGFQFCCWLWSLHGLAGSRSVNRFYFILNACPRAKSTSLGSSTSPVLETASDVGESRKRLWHAEREQCKRCKKCKLSGGKCETFRPQRKLHGVRSLELVRAKNSKQRGKDGKAEAATGASLGIRHSKCCSQV